MSATLAIFLAVLGVLLLAVAVGAARAQGPRSTSLHGMAERERAMAAQADVEEHDIDEMVQARDALRRRIGKPTIGDELADEARGKRPEEP